MKRARLEVEDAEAVLRVQVAPDLNPEQVFARQWALAVVKSAQEHTRKHYESRGDAVLFDVLQPSLVGESAPYAQLAAQLDQSDGAVKVAVHRLRKRFREALRAEVADTLDGPAEIEEELRLLMNSLAGR